jgi:hypothetical protein
MAKAAARVTKNHYTRIFLSQATSAGLLVLLTKFLSCEEGSMVMCFPFWFDLRYFTILVSINIMGSDMVFG